MTNTYRFSAGLCAVALLGALSAAPAFAAPTVAFSGPSRVLSGSSFLLDVSASGFTDLYAYQFDISFDPALFKAVGIARGAFLATAGSTFFDGGVIDNTAGMISFVIESVIGPGTGANGAGGLVQLSFGAVGAGSRSGSFALTNFAAFDSSLNPINVDLRVGSVSVPEPSSLALAMVAMGAVCLGSSGRARHVGVVAKATT